MFNLKALIPNGRDTPSITAQDANECTLCIQHASGNFKRVVQMRSDTTCTIQGETTEVIVGSRPVSLGRISS